MNQTILWAARSFAILFVLMISMFALDIEKFSWTALFWHIGPALMLLVFLIVAWLKPKLGGLLWILTALVYVVLTWSKVQLTNYLVVALPLVVIGSLFLVIKRDAAMISPVAKQPDNMKNQLNN